jgi:hypothetical protein
MTWYDTFDGKHIRWYLATSPIRYPNLARLEFKLGKWSLEMWRPIDEVDHDWEFIARFDDLEEAKRVGYTLARLEN